MLFIRKQFCRKGSTVFLGAFSVGVLWSFTGCDKGAKTAVPAVETAVDSATKALEAETRRRQQEEKAQADRIKQQEDRRIAKEEFFRKEVERSKSAAIKEYPELAEAESEFAKDFDQRVKAMEVAKSVDLESASWPLSVAREVSRDLDRKREIALSKARAVKDFPELAVAGSAFNLEFVKRVKELEDLKAPEIKVPSWPYTLARQVAGDLELARQVEASKARALNEFPDLKRPGSELYTEFARQSNLMRDNGDFGLRNPQWPYNLAFRLDRELKSPTRIFLTKELQGLSELPPGEIYVKGRVSKVDSFLSDGVSGRIILDGILSCDVSLSAANNRGPAMTLVRKDDGLYSQLKSRSGPSSVGEKCLYRIAQDVTVHGTVKRLFDGRLAFKIVTSGY